MPHSEADNKALVKRYLTAFNDRDYDALADLAADDMVEHGVDEEMRGIDEVVEFLESYHETFPDYSGDMEALIAEDDLVTVRYTARGTHTGEYADIDPTGHYVEWTGIAIYRIDDGQVAEVWVEEDRLTVLEELEAVETTHPHFEL